MENIQLEATERTPKVTCNWETGELELIGESYPENVTEFYGPILKDLESYLDSDEGITITCNFELLYFNSSSAKVLMRIFDMFEEAAEEKNHDISVNWRVDEEDDNMKELGEEFAEDIETINFEVITK